MPPNVLLVVVDQLAAHTVGCYGGPVPTPNIDRLAVEGARFTDATCPTPFCSPSRASLATGQYPHRHGIVHNVMRRDYPRSRAEPTEEGLRADDPTVGRLLADAGYDTHHYGKFHLLDEDLPYYPDMFTEHDAYAKGMAGRFRAVRARPREEWMDWYGWALPVTVDDRYREAVDPVREELAAAGGHDEFLTKMGRLEFDPGDTFDWQVADRAAGRIESADEPFFLTASFNWPHDPNVVPDPWYSEFDPDDLSLPDNYGAFEDRFAGDWSREYVSLVGERGVREFLRVYYGMVAFVDDQVGRVLDALDRRGVADDTLVVFTSDHGDMAGGHGMVWKSTGAFYDEVMRVPLLVRGPGVAADEVDCAASLVDVLPTVWDLLGRE
ncbi:MAG: sulfatase, partial [Halobacteriaceae archaeon]